MTHPRISDLPDYDGWTKGSGDLPNYNKPDGDKTICICYNPYIGAWSIYNGHDFVANTKILDSAMKRANRSTTPQIDMIPKVLQQIAGIS